MVNTLIIIEKNITLRNDMLVAKNNRLLNLEIEDDSKRVIN